MTTRSLAVAADRDVFLAILLDMANVFNSLPIETLREALRYYGMALHLWRLLDDNL